MLRVPFGPVDLQVGALRVRDDLLHAFDLRGEILAYAVRAAFAVGVVDLFVLRVEVRRNEVQRYAVVGAVVDHVLDPVGLRRGGAADAQAPVHRFEPVCTRFVEFEILVFRTRPESRQVRFVPHFEIPFAHFVESVAPHQVLRELVHEQFPFAVILRRGDVGLVPEELLRAGSQRVGHRVQFDERADAHRQQRVVDLVDLVPLEGQRAVFRPFDYIHVAVEQRVEAAVAVAQLFLRRGELFEQVGPQQQVGPSHGDAVAPRHPQLPGCRRGGDRERLRRRPRRNGRTRMHAPGGVQPPLRFGTVRLPGVLLRSVLLRGVPWSAVWSLDAVCLCGSCRVYPYLIRSPGGGYSCSTGPCSGSGAGMPGRRRETQ